METIQKIVLELSKNPQSFKMPKGSSILYCREQRMNISIWYSCDPEKEKETRVFLIVPTGGQVPLHLRYVGTAIFAKGELVLHVGEFIKSEVIIERG